MEWLGNEWEVEKERAEKAEIVILELDKKIKDLVDKVNKDAEEVAKWREMYEACQKQGSTMAQEATERVRMITSLSQEKNHLQGKLEALETDYENTQREVEGLESEIKKLRAKGSFYKAICKIIDKIKERGDKYADE